VTVLEPDPLYSKAATPRASGGARRLFSRPENIEMSNYSIPFYEHFAGALHGRRGAAGDRLSSRDGYLFLVPPEGVGIIERNHALQTSLGVKVDLLDREALKRRFPEMNVSDIGAASHAHRGWLPRAQWRAPGLPQEGARAGRGIPGGEGRCACRRRAAPSAP
jgi:FAD-dependent oxidoreductase domain-containing protein 1